MTEALGQKIQAYRKEEGLTQAQLADKLGVTDKAVSKCERNLSLPDMPTLMDLGKLMNLSVDQLLSSENQGGKRWKQ